jgi:hypothetical protein
MSQARRFGPKFMMQACAAVVILVASCDACGDPTSESAACNDFDPATGCQDDEAAPIDIAMRNNSTQNVHLFLVDRGETFPCCQTPPGLAREIIGYLYLDGANVTVAAGRNGAILETKSCQISESEFDTGKKIFIWNNSLSC